MPISTPFCTALIASLLAAGCAEPDDPASTPPTDLGIRPPDGGPGTVDAALDARVPDAQPPADAFVSPLPEPIGSVDYTVSGRTTYFADSEPAGDARGALGEAPLDRWSIAVWARPLAAGPGGVLVSNDRPGLGDDVVLGILPEAPGCGATWAVLHEASGGEGLTVACDPEPPDEAFGWTHVVATSDGDFLTLYVDGEPRAREPRAGASLTYGSGPGVVGGDGVRSFQGDIAEVQWFDGALSGAEVERLFTDRPDAPVVEPYVTDADLADEFELIASIRFIEGREVVTDLGAEALLFRPEGSSGAFDTTASATGPRIDLARPHSVTFAGGHYFAADTGHHRILRFDSLESPTAVDELQVTDPVDGKVVCRPHDIVYDPVGDYLYAVSAYWSAECDPSRHSGRTFVYRFRPDLSGVELVDLSCVVNYARSLTVVDGRVVVANASTSLPDLGWGAAGCPSETFQNQAVEVTDFPAESFRVHPLPHELNDIEFYRGRWYGVHYDRLVRFESLESPASEFEDVLEMLSLRTRFVREGGQFPMRLYSLEAHGEDLYVAGYSSAAPGAFDGIHRLRVE